MCFGGARENLQLLWYQFFNLTLRGAATPGRYRSAVLEGVRADEV